MLPDWSISEKYEIKLVRSSNRTIVEVRQRKRFFAPSIYYLDGVIEENLRWHNHVDKIVFILHRTKSLLNTSVSHMIYHAYIASRLTYRYLAVWRSVASFKLNQLKVLQYSAIKSVMRLPRLTASSSFFSANCLSIGNILTYELIMLKFIFKVKENTIRHNLTVHFEHPNPFMRNRNNNYRTIQIGGRAAGFQRTDTRISLVQSPTDSSKN